jgi:muramoyltetrapeptide carboxypeptidase
MITPEYLKPGDKVGFVAPARKCEPEELKKAVSIIEQWGLSVVFGKNLFCSQNQFAGTDEERAADFQQMLDDESVKAIICIRGGYGSVRTLQGLDFSKFIKNPKWIVGYSDVTVFHSYVNQNLGIETLHSAMPFNFQTDEYDKESVSLMKDFLFGNIHDYKFEGHELNKKGNATGTLIGGNLSVIYSLRGTPAEINTEGKILFIEDIGEYLYHIDRMMMNLKYGGKLNGLKGLIVGDMTEMTDNKVPFGKTPNEIIADVMCDINIPVCYGFKAGHGDKNLPLLLGREITLDVAETCQLNFTKYKAYS